MNENPKLPLWRKICGIAVLGAFAGVIAFLTPVYVDDLQLWLFERSLGASLTDEQMVAAVVGRAHELDLPVRAGDVRIARSGGKARVELRYTVKMDLLVYPVDLHFPTLR